MSRPDFIVTPEGVQLPDGFVFEAHGHINIKISTLDGEFVRDAGIHFDPNNNQPGGVFIGESFYPVVLADGECISWVQVHGWNYHFGENGEELVCVVQPDPEPEPDPDPEPEPDEESEEESDEGPDDIDDVLAPDDTPEDSTPDAVPATPVVPIQNASHQGTEATTQVAAEPVELAQTGPVDGLIIAAFGVVIAMAGVILLTQKLMNRQRRD